MHVIATAGHVDHGKSALVRALTGMEPDRWAEERRRGMTIDLGFAWSTLLSGDAVAFVDVPGHERFIANMLAGIGPLPAVMMVVAADEGWMPQSEEHLRAIDALVASHGLLVVTKSDLADPQPAVADARQRIARTSLGDVAAVAVSSHTGAGLDALRAELSALVALLPPPDVDTPVRLWIDRAFTVAGAGSVVTGTLAAGTIRVRDELVVMPAARAVTVRALESCKESRREVPAVARIAVNVRGAERGALRRGMALVTPGAWTDTSEVDAVSLEAQLPGEMIVHIGSAGVPARVRRLGQLCGAPTATFAYRLRLAAPLPLHLGDRFLMRDPGRRFVARADVADVHPVPLRRRGDAARIAAGLHTPATPDDEVSRHGVVSESRLSAAGLATQPTRAVHVDGRWIDQELWQRWLAALPVSVRKRIEPLSAGVSLDVLRRDLGVPDRGVMLALVHASAELTFDDGRVGLTNRRPVDVPGLRSLRDRLVADPLDAPDANDLRELGLGPAELAQATRQGQLLRLSEGVYVGASAVAVAADRLTSLDAPFTVSDARQTLGVSRRVVVPLLEHLDAARLTRKLPDGTRVMTARPT